MGFQSIEIVRLQLQFNSGFEHSRKARHTGDSLLLKLTTDTQHVGWGEILPRQYVTGETVDGILTDVQDQPGVASLTRSLSEAQISSQQQLEQWIDEKLKEYSQNTALFGGLELAMWDILSQKQALDLDQAVGQRNERTIGRCVTIGFDAETDKLRARAIDAKLKKASVVKLKIGLADDIDRVRLLDNHLNSGVPIRLDANGLYDTDRLKSILQSCAGRTLLQSIEQPFSHTDDSCVDIQQDLYARYGIPFVADESVCSLEDANRWLKTGGFQIFNLRIGKHGGLRATRRIRDMATRAGIGLVSGSMVGETGILTQASEVLLNRSAEFDYVEGLGQNRSFLTLDPVEKIESAGPLHTFKLKDEATELVQWSRVYNCN